MNRGQLKTRVSRIVGIGLGTDDDAVDETALLEELANEAVIDILIRTRIHIRKATATLAEGSTDFDVDQAILRIFGLRRGTDPTGTLLVEMPREELTGDGFAFAGLSRITLGIPASAGETLTFWYTPQPTPMTADAHDPANLAYGRIPTQHHRAILDYMCWHSSDREGDRETSRGDHYRVLYEGQDGQGSLGSDLGRIKLETNLRGGATMVTRRQAVLAHERSDNYWRG